ncbi:MAG: hypothetical protein NZ821_08050 [Gloeomargarita sp. SKYB31]|nr:hypothetical protein [Gloeomargarita sp. SKYG98]MCS7226926.1 hypothetical protein [Gloeomargarita sp. SKYB31]
MPEVRWLSLTPAGPLSLGNLTPVGQNSGQVGCRWPPNGHQLAACLQLPASARLWGPFWHRWGQRELYVSLPLPVYALDDGKDAVPAEVFRLQNVDGYWQPRPEHQGQPIKAVGGSYLVSGVGLRLLWRAGKLKVTHDELVTLPWQTLTLSHNSREDYQVKEEGGFFAEMTTLMEPGWSILAGILGDYEPPEMSTLGAGGMPVVVQEVKLPQAAWQWLGETCERATGGVLLTGALWSSGTYSQPYPQGVSLRGYAAEMGQPWQSWKRVKDRRNPSQQVSVLTPGEWLTPAGAVYLWQEPPPVQHSGPWPDPFHRDALGYGHIWLFRDEEP